MLLDDAVGNGKAQAAAVILGGEERIKYRTQVFLGDTMSIIAYMHTYFLFYRNISCGHLHISAGIR